MRLAAALLVMLPLAAVQRALESQGVEFIDNGVRLKDSTPAPGTG